MQAPFNHIVQHLFHQPSLHSVTVDEIENMAQQHPYFAAAHFLLLKKMQDTNHPQFNAQLHKTTLYFNNPLWLQYLLQPETVGNLAVSEKAPFIVNETVLPFAAHDKEETENTITPAEAILQKVRGSVSAADGQTSIPAAETIPLQSGEPVVTQTQGGIMDVITDVFHENTDETRQPFFEPATVSTDTLQKDEFTAASPETAAIVQTPEEQITASESFVPDAIADDAAKAAGAIQSHPITDENNVQAFKQAPAETGNIENNWEPNPEADTAPVQHNAEAAVVEPDTVPGQKAEEALVSEMAATVDPPAASASVHHENAAGVQQEETTTHEVADAETDNQALNAENKETGEQPAETATPAIVAAETERPLVKTIIETPSAQGDLLFEPYHTVDYFASQGIKLSKIEADSKDRLGRQLKSFTEWLRTMKKLPQVSIEKILSENEESKVVADARHSIENKEVITEAMAEVFEKQGMVEKAAEVYRKLSLQNPAKSAYFAAKIEELKH